MSKGSKYNSTGEVHARFQKQFTTRALWALAIAAVLSISSLVASLVTSSDDVSSPAEINVSGRQRMLSQRIALLATEAAVTDEPGLLREELADLDEAIALMDNSHMGLLEGSASMGLSGQLSPALRGHYFEPPARLDMRQKAFLERARAVHGALSRGEPVDAGSLSALQHDARGDFLVLLNQAVVLHQRNSEETIAMGRRTQVLIFALMVGAMLFAFFGIFLPLRRTIRWESRELQRIEESQALQSEQNMWLQRFQRALDMIDTEEGVLKIVARAMGSLVPAWSMEVLLAAASQARVDQAVTHPEHGAPGCQVASPWGCVAVRRGRATIFESSQALDACPMLYDRASPCSAVCVPVTFMGRSIGVLHATGPEHMGPDEVFLEQLKQLAGQSGTRIGTVRTFEKVQRQATTDPLTGLINRRTLMDTVTPWLSQGRKLSLVMADLDHFKRLNDTFGHDAGDRALCVFAKVFKTVLGEDHVVARFGGEEFVAVLVDMDAKGAVPMLNTMRRELAKTLTASTTPIFTVSMGVADSTMTDDMHALLRIADETLYEAKDKGRDRVLVASRERKPTVDLPATLGLTEFDASRQGGKRQAS